MATEAPAASSGIAAHAMVLEGSTENKPPEPVATKKPYRPPTLVCWGTLLDITRHVGAHGSTDGGGGGNSQNRDKTRP